MSSEHESIQPSQPNRIFAALRDVCAALYPEERDTRLIVADAGLDERQVAFSSRAQTNWHNILAEAVRDNRLDALLGVARRAYPTNQLLQTAIANYHALIEAGGQLDAPTQLPVGVDPYNVDGLVNPYLGLRAFRYEDRAIYAGREQLAQETVQYLTAPGTQQPLLFITGASGSGKSSFAQAGLIPLLENHYAAYQKSVRHAIFRPSSQPMVILADALQKLHPDLTPETLTTNTPKDQINLLLIDQFEELFIQSDAGQRALLCDFLINLPEFATSRIHILITLRVDYLDELFAIQPLWVIAKEGVELRAMSADDLRHAIQKPLQVTHPQKRFAPELLDRLVQDGGADAALLPLLQVTLAELWKTGKLILSNYHSLTNAIRQRAEMVYTCSDHASADPKTPRSVQEQQELMSILLDLINVSVEGTDRRDARQRRTRQELEQGSPYRPWLIEELVNARLLSAATETRNSEDVEVIDIIHESLIENWDRLKQAIDEQRQQLQRRARFQLWLGEWLRSGRQDGYLLLTDMQLAEARALVEARDIEVQGGEAQDFYQHSLEYQATAQRIKDKAEAEHKARQQWLRRVGVALVIMVVAAGIALWQWQRAETAKVVAETARSESERLKAQIRADQIAQKASLSNIDITLEQHPQRAILLAIEAVKAVTPPIRSALQSLHDLLGRVDGRGLGENKSGVYSVALSPDTDMLASGNRDGTIQLWSLSAPSNDPILLQGHNAFVSSISFSPDGGTLASGGGDGVIRLWRLAGPDREPIVLQGHEGSINSVTFSPDGKTLASGGWDGVVRLWGLAGSDREPIVLQGHEGPINSVTFSPDGKTLASASDDATIRLWSMTDLISAPMVLNKHKTDVNSVVFSPDGKTLVSAGGDWFWGDHTIYLWSLAELDREPQQLNGHVGPVTSLVTASDSKILASASDDKTIRLWSLTKPDGEPLVLKGHEGPITSLAITSDSKTLASASDDKTIRLWSLTKPDGEPLVLKGHEDAIFDLNFSPDGKMLASASADKTIRLWSIVDMDNEPIVLTGHQDTVLGVAFSPDGKMLASGSVDGTIRLWSLVHLSSGSVIFKGQEGRVTSIAFAEDHKTLASASSDRPIRLWSLTDRESEPIVLNRNQDAIFDIAFSPDSKTLASAGVDKVIRLWSLVKPDSEPIVLNGHQDAIMAIAFSPDGKRLASASKDGTVRLWSLLQEGDEVAIIKAHEYGVNSVSFSPDGKTLASTSDDKTIRIWLLTELEREPIMLNGHENSVLSVSFSLDGKMLASASADRTIRLWHLETEELLTLACNIVGRNLRQEEWQQYFPNEEYRRTCPQWPSGR